MEALAVLLLHALKRSLYYFLTPDLYYFLTLLTSFLATKEITSRSQQSNTKVIDTCSPLKHLNSNPSEHHRLLDASTPTWPLCSFEYLGKDGLFTRSKCRCLWPYDKLVWHWLLVGLPFAFFGLWLLLTVYSQSLDVEPKLLGFPRANCHLVANGLGDYRLNDDLSNH